LLQHANGENPWVGIDGRSGDIVDMKERKVVLLCMNFTAPCTPIMYACLSTTTVFVVDLGFLQCEGTDVQDSY
jgi:hypothetical protein